MGKHAAATLLVYSRRCRADNRHLSYASRFERFECSRGDGRSAKVEFVRAGTLTAGDRPELYFFRVDTEEVTVGISGSALEEFQRQRRLSREEKVDLAGLHLQRQMQAGQPLDSRALYVHWDALLDLANELQIHNTRQP